MILFTRLLFWADGFTPFPWLIVLHPRMRHASGLASLLAHERKHQEQMRRDGWLRFVWRYLFVQKWRLSYEVEAYRVSIVGGMPIALAANLIASNYRLSYSAHYIESLLYGEA
jgi:hypothetical protein